MNIVCATDNNYVKYCGIMLASLFENNSFEHHTVHLLTEGLSADNRRVLEEFVCSFNAHFCYYELDSSFVSSCPIKETDHLTIATYYRLFITDILPTNIDKVLYLDCDIIINRSIQELWNTNLSGYAIAAVEELGASAEDVYERLNYDKKYGYFNAGVLLINLAFWREHRMTSLFCNYININRSRLKAHDQDVLNALLHDKCLLLPCKWNVEEAFYHYLFMKRVKQNRELRYALRYPSVLHYTWKPKPWDPMCVHPFRINFFIFQNKTPWREPIPLRKTMRRLWDKYFFCFLLWAGITGRRFYRLK